MSLTANDTFEVNRGSDLPFQFNWPNGAGGNLDLTGYTVDGYEVSPELAPFITFTLTTPAQGLISCRINWDDSLPVYQEMSFRIRIAKDGDNTTTNLLKVVYK